MLPRRDFGPKRNPWTTWIAILVAFAVGGGLLWTMQAAFQVGDDMVRSIDATRPLSRPRPLERERGYVRARPSGSEHPAADPTVARTASRPIKGRVVIPAGTPADEELHVVLVAESRVLLRVPVDPEREFRLDPDPALRGTAVRLDGRYLFLDRDFPVDCTAPPAETVLEPRLGGRIVGRVRLPEEHEGARPLLVHAAFRMRQERGVDGTHHGGTRTRLDDALGFEFRALDPSLPVAIDALAPLSERIAPQTLRVRPGETHALVLDVDLGAVIGGIVRGVDGAPIQGARCTLRCRTGGVTREVLVLRRDLTGEDGTFLIVGVPPEAEALVVRCHGYHEHAEPFAPLATTEWRTDLEVCLRSTGSIAGRVVWTDGRPADGAWVCAEPQHGGGEPRTVLADESGCFDLDRLSGERFTITAGLGVRPWLDGPDDTPAAPGSAVVHGVASGTRDLLLRLTRSAALRGHVFDDQGAPWTRVLVVARPVVGGTVCTTPLRVKSAGPSESDGVYQIDGLHAGDWEVQATSGAFRSPRQRVRIDAADAWLDLALSRVPAIGGVVLDEHGQPAARQPVYLVRPDRAAEAFDFRSDQHVARTDAAGLFEIAECELGAALLWAGSRWDRMSPIERIDVVAGRPLSGLRLRLQTQGRLRCRVLDVEKRPIAGAHVLVRPLAGSGLKIATDRIVSHRGESLEQRLPAGEYLVHASSGRALSAPVVVSVQPDREVEVVLELAPAARAKVRVRGARGEVALTYTDSAGADALAELEPRTPGSTTWTYVLLPGRYRLVAVDAERRSVEREIELCAGEERELVLEFGD